jgi:hypothetical protein
MKTKSILFITFDLSGYYDCINDELKSSFKNVDYENTSKLDYKYTSVFQKIYSFFFKIFTGKKLKNYYKVQPIIKKYRRKKYDYILIIRPDIFFDSQLLEFKKMTPNLIAYYHDSINNIPRKRDIIKYFDKVYSYEKKDVTENNLNFITNFIYLNKRIPKVSDFDQETFTIMSNDYRIKTLKALADYLNNKGISSKFLIHTHKKHNEDDKLLTYIYSRKNNTQVLEYLRKSRIIIDIHKFGIQEGLTFRVFESLYLNKKLITTNSDIKNYDFYNPSNIRIIYPDESITIPDDFFTTPYEKIPDDIYEKYLFSNWIKEILT